MKKFLIELKKDNDKNYTIKISDRALPSFQKIIVNGADSETFVEFIIEDF